jgi:hypothetical protein
MTEIPQIMPPMGPEPVGWETDREWELEQRAFHCNENWTFEDIRQLVNDLWFQYCLAANPIRMEKALAAKDAEIERLRDALHKVEEYLKYNTVVSEEPELERIFDTAFSSASLNGGSDAP